jgi:hypothetical protein
MEQDEAWWGWRGAVGAATASAASKGACAGEGGRAAKEQGRPSACRRSLMEQRLTLYSMLQGQGRERVGGGQQLPRQLTLQRRCWPRRSSPTHPPPT